MINDLLFIEKKYEMNILSFFGFKTKLILILKASLHYLVFDTKSARDSHHYKLEMPVVLKNDKIDELRYYVLMIIIAVFQHSVNPNSKDSLTFHQGIKLQK